MLKLSNTKWKQSTTGCKKGCIQRFQFPTAGTSRRIRKVKANFRLNGQISIAETEAIVWDLQLLGMHIPHSDKAGPTCIFEGVFLGFCTKVWQCYDVPVCNFEFVMEIELPWNTQMSRPPAGLTMTMMITVSGG